MGKESYTEIFINCAISKLKRDEMGRICSMQEGNEKFFKNFDHEK
jgi:hypothetical protein